MTITKEQTSRRMSRCRERMVAQTWRRLSRLSSIRTSRPLALRTLQLERVDTDALGLIATLRQPDGQRALLQLGRSTRPICEPPALPALPIVRDAFRGPNGDVAILTDRPPGLALRCVSTSAGALGEQLMANVAADALEQLTQLHSAGGVHGALSADTLVLVDHEHERRVALGAGRDQRLLALNHRDHEALVAEQRRDVAALLDVVEAAIQRTSSRSPHEARGDSELAQWSARTRRTLAATNEPALDARAHLPHVAQTTGPTADLCRAIEARDWQAAAAALARLNEQPPAWLDVPEARHTADQLVLMIDFAFDDPTVIADDLRTLALRAILASRTQD